MNEEKRAKVFLLVCGALVLGGIFAGWKTLEPKPGADTALYQRAFREGEPLPGLVFRVDHAGQDKRQVSIQFEFEGVRQFVVEEWPVSDAGVGDEVEVRYLASEDVAVTANNLRLAP